MAGELQAYYTVEKGDRIYIKRGSWGVKEHLAAHMNQETAERIARRYPGASISKNHGYGISFKFFEDLEPDAIVALQQAVKLAARDGMSLETILVQVEKAFHANNPVLPEAVKEI